MFLNCKVGPPFSEFVKKNKPEKKNGKMILPEQRFFNSEINDRNSKFIVEIKREFGDFKETL